MNKFFKRQSIILLAFVVIGVYFLTRSHASTGSVSVEVETGTKPSSNNAMVETNPETSGGSSIRFSSVKRFFADDASWNKPVSSYGYADPGSKLESFKNVFWKCAGWDSAQTTPDCLTDANYETTHAGLLPSSLAVSFADYSYPMYNYDTHTTYNGTVPLGSSLDNPCGGGAEVYQKLENNKFYPISSDHSVWYGDCMPWNYNWQPGFGTDHMMAVIDYSTGKVWSYAGVLTPRTDGNMAQKDDFTISTEALQCNGDPNTTIQHGVNGETRFPFIGNTYPYYDYRTQVCGYGFGFYPFTNPANNKTSGNIFTAGDTAKDQPTMNGHGIGVNTEALITRAAEVKSGAIKHALELSIASTMFADTETCPPPGQTGTCTTKFCNPVTDPEAPGAGNTCAIMLPPANYIEFTSGTNTRMPGSLYPATDWHRQRTVPEGMRIALDPSFNIDDWVNNYPGHSSWTTEKKNTAKIFAVALRDYGAIIAETARAGITMMTDGVLDSTPGGSRDIWASQGITFSGCPQDDEYHYCYPHADLLQGLLSNSNIKIVKPPARDPKQPSYP